MHTYFIDLFVSIHFSIDVTKNDGHKGRIFNHSRKKCQCVHKSDSDSYRYKYSTPLLKATRNIGIGEEPLYDYGERNKDVVEANPWLLD